MSGIKLTKTVAITLKIIVYLISTQSADSAVSSFEDSSVQLREDFGH